MNPYTTGGEQQPCASLLAAGAECWWRVRRGDVPSRGKPQAPVEYPHASEAGEGGRTRSNGRAGAGVCSDEDGVSGRFIWCFMMIDI